MKWKKKKKNLLCFLNIVQQCTNLAASCRSCRVFRNVSLLTCVEVNYIWWWKRQKHRKFNCLNQLNARLWRINCFALNKKLEEFSNFNSLPVRWPMTSMMHWFRPFLLSTFICSNLLYGWQRSAHWEAKERDLLLACGSFNS